MTYTTLVGAVGLSFLAACAQAETAGPIALGDLQISGAYIRATLPNQPVAGGYMAIQNTGNSGDTLLSATSGAAGRTELHEMAMDGDVMRMRELSGGLPLPAGGTVVLAPGGYHLMMMDLAGAMEAGDTAPVTLTFAEAGDITLDLPILPTEEADRLEAAR